MRNALNSSIFPATAILAAVIFILAPGRAEAACCVAPTGIVQAINQAEQSIAKAVNQSEKSIVQAVETLTRTTEGWFRQLMGQMKEENEGLKKAIADEGKLAREYDALNRTQLPASACVSGEAGNVVERAEAARKDAAKRYSGASGGLSSGPKMPPGANATLKNLVEKPTRTEGEAAAKTYNIHGQFFCNAEDARVYNGILCKGKGRLEDADIQASTVFDGAGEEQSTSYTQEQLDAAKAYQRNVLDALNAPMLTPQQAKTSAGKAYHALQIASKAMLSLGTRPMDNAIASRTVSPRLKDTYKEIIKNSESASAYYSRLASTKYKNGMSEMGLIEFEVGRRYANPDWYAEVAGMKANSPIEKEALYMQALQLDLERRQLAKLESIEILLGAKYSAQVRQEMNPRLAAQYRSVAGAMGRQ